MSTRIFFNGQHYDGPEAMPEAVRKSYEELLATSIVVNGRTLDSLDDVPGPLRGLLGYALRTVAGDLPAAGDRPAGGDHPAIGPARTDVLLQRLNAIQRKFALLLQLLSLFVAGAVIVVGGWMISHMDAGSRSQGGAVYVGIAMVIGLVWAIGMFVSASRRFGR